MISDPDGYTFLRGGPGKTYEITDTLLNGELFYVFDEGENGWFPVDVTQNGTQKQGGWIHQSRIMRLDSLPSVPIETASATTLSFRDTSVHVLIKTTPFAPETHTLTYEKGENSSSLLSRIDEGDIYGTDGRMPRKEYSSIEVQLNGKALTLPSSSWKNLFEPNLGSGYTQVYRKPDSNTLYIIALNGDAAGAYAVCWVFEQGLYKERIIFIPF